MKRYLTILLVVLISIGAYAQTGLEAYSLSSYQMDTKVVFWASDTRATQTAHDICPYRHEYAGQIATSPGDRIVAYTESGGLVVTISQTATIAVYDMTGRRIARFDAVSGTIRIPVQAGAYIIKASIDSQDYVLKVVVR